MRLRVGWGTQVRGWSENGGFADKGVGEEFEVGLGVGGDAGLVEVLGEDVEGGVALGGEAGGGEDGFELAGAYDGVDFGDVGADFVAVALDQAAGYDDAGGFAAVLALVLDHFEDGVDGFLFGGIDKGTGVDDDDVGFVGAGDEVGAVVVEETHHDFGVDEVFGAAEGDETDFGAGLSGGFGGFED